MMPKRSLLLAALLAGACLVAGAGRSLAFTGGAGLLRMDFNDLGFAGNGFSSSYYPSLRYPYSSHVEHLYLAGLWVGARRDDGTLGVDTATYDCSGISLAMNRCEFGPVDGAFRVTSNDVNSDHYSPDAIAPYQLERTFDDDRPTVTGHVPLGIRVHLRALSWDAYALDDVLVLEYSVTNVSGAPLSDVYVGWYEDTTVGNTDVNNPYDLSAPVRWNYFDDVNGAWRPGDKPGDPDLWMMWEHDGDGDGGFATSWVGCRLLGCDPLPEPAGELPPVSYNAYSYGGFPDEDDAYIDGGGDPQPGLYQIMGNGDFDVGGDFAAVGNWGAVLSTGPFPTLAPGDSLTVTFAMVCGEDEDALWRNGRRIHDLYLADWAFDPTPVPETAAAGATLRAPYPNPFNPDTEIRFGLARASTVDLAVFAVDGRRVRSLARGALPAGEHRLRWNGRDDHGRDVASGAYLVRLEVGGRTIATRRAVLVR